MLADFIAAGSNMTGPELETAFNNGASLFLTRISAWLRLTYMNPSSHVALQLRAIHVFVGASSGQRFLVEFMEVGGALTVLEILSLKASTEDDLSAAVELLLAFADAGRKFKEILCESKAIKYVSKCLSRVQLHQTRQAARDLLYQLAMGNPSYQAQVVEALIALLPSGSSGAQMMAAQVLRLIIPMLDAVDATVVEPVLSLLTSLELQVQYEGCELLKELVKSEDLTDTIIAGLIGMLKPDAGGKGRAGVSASASAGGSVLFYSQQAAAAKTIGILCTTSTPLVVPFVRLQAINGLLHAMGNDKYPDSQLQGTHALEVVLANCYGLIDEVKREIGSDLFLDIMQSREQAFTRMSRAHLEVLSGNMFHVDENDPRAQPGGSFFGSDL